jgi:DNA-binding NtrC family response regulator
MNCATVLIVDDEPFARQAIAEWLREKNFHVFEADSGTQAMERIQEDNMDIVISDMVMPGMDGLQFLKKAKAAKVDIPFLMDTGYPSHAAAIKVMQEGASDYLAKPFTPEELMHRVNRTLMLKALDKPLASVSGIILGAALSAVMWMLIIGALSSLLR